MARALIVVISSLFLLTCTHRWVAIPQHIPDFEKCKVLKDGPQMLKIPEFERSYIIVRDCLTMDRQRVSIAITIFLEEWKKKFSYQLASNRKVEKSMHNLMAEFNDDQKSANAYSVDGRFGNNLPLAGLTTSPGYIWVKTMRGERLCYTSFVHELVHVAIWAIKGTDGDPDHMGHQYSGWGHKHMIVMQETNRRLWELGI